MENKFDFGSFIMGLFFGAIVTTFFMVVSLISEPTTIQTYKKLTPKTKLTTDGVKVDTLYIYTSK